jgi:c-di-GMP-related signal transduction protein
MEDIILRFYVARQPILNKHLFAYGLLRRNSLENRHVSAAPAKIIEVLVFTLGLKSLTQGYLAFINLAHDPLINTYCLSSKQYFQSILSALTPYPCIQSPSKKIETYSDLPPANIDVTQTEAALEVCKC